MMTTDLAASAAHSSLVLVLLWVLVFWCLRGYRIDAFRQNLFALRDELFDYAAGGAVPFEHQAYTKLRTSLNSMIRFAHRATFLRVLITVALAGMARDHLIRKGYEEWFHGWEDALKSLPSVETGQRLRNFHTRMLVLLVKHLVTGSPLLLLGISGFAAGFAVWRLVTGVSRRLIDAFAERVPGLDLLEAQALLEAQT